MFRNKDIELMGQVSGIKEGFVMIVNPIEFHIRNLSYTMRSAKENDAKNLSEIRLQIDGETENMDREKGEAYIDEVGFKKLIKEDTESAHNIF
jgi:hypothetical protein